LSNRLLDQIAKVGGFLDTHSGGRAQMQLERTAVNAWKEVAAQPRNQNRERAEAACKERNQESAPVVEANLQQVAIAVTKSLEGLFKTLLKSNKRITAWGTCLMFVTPQQVLGHGRDDGPGKQVRGQHSENHSFGERHKEISGDAGQQEHRSKHDADRECRHEGGCGDLRRAVEDNFVHVLLGFRLAVAINVLDLNGRVVHQNADRQSQPAERHDINRFSDRTEHNDGGQDCQRDGSRDDNGASPTAEKSENHESGQTGGDQSFPDDTTDRSTNKNGLIRQRCNAELRWNCGLDLRQQCLDAGDHVQRSVLLTIQKAGNASTLNVIAGIKALLPQIKTTVPAQLDIAPLADQSIFVRSAISGVVRETLIAACLTAFMILSFLGSWRSTVIIATSIPLAILTSIIVLSAIGETINIMTLGGLALAVGILVDDATVEVENINRNREAEPEKDMDEIVLDSASQIATPAFVSTLSICIVFAPMFLLSGVARYLFVPLAEAVVFAMLASYFLSRTIVPTMAKYLLRGDKHEASAPSRNPLVRLQKRFEEAFERFRRSYRSVLEICLRHRRAFLIAFFASCLGSLAILIPWLGRDFFPSVDSGSFKLHLRAPTGMRIEETANLCDLVERSIRQQIPASEVQNVIDNIGLPFSGINLSY